MKKRLLSIVTATAMTLTALPLTVNAAELDEYINSSNEVITEFFDGFTVNSEYDVKDATLFTNDNNQLIIIRKADTSFLVLYPSVSDDYEKIFERIKENFPKAECFAVGLNKQELEMYLKEYGGFIISNLNASLEQIEKVCYEITSEFEINKIVLRHNEYEGHLYDVEKTTDVIDLVGQLKDIDLHTDKILYSKDNAASDEIIAGESHINTQVSPSSEPIKKTTTTTAEPATNDTPVTKGNGDANCDGIVNMADAVIIMQSLANPDKYGVNGTDETHITAQGEFNADMNGNGLTNADALEIQKMLLKLS